MTVKHGTRYRYSKGCRCDACAEAARTYQRDYRLRGGGEIPHHPQVMPDFNGLPESPGPVEVGVQAEISSAAEARPGLAQTALALARLMDDPKAVSQKPAAAKALTSLLDKLHQAAAPGRRGHLAVVRTMTKNGGA